MLRHIQSYEMPLLQHKGRDTSGLPGSCPFSFTRDSAVLSFKGFFLINRQLKSSLGGGRQGSMNQLCKQGNQGEERLSKT